MVVTGIISSEEAVRSIDHNTVGLLVGMMIVVGVLSKSGLFQYLALGLGAQARPVATYGVGAW